MAAYQRTGLLIKLGFWLALIFASYMAFAPPKAIPNFQLSGVILHAVTFAVLTYGVRMAYFPSARPKAWLVASLWMLAYGVGIELVQSFTPQRVAEVFDVMVDILGIAVGLVAYRFAGEWSLNLARRLIG